MNTNRILHLLSIILIVSLLFPAASAWAAPEALVKSAPPLVISPLKNNGSLYWNTFLGGNDADYTEDQGSDIAIDGSGNIYIAGSSYVTWGAPKRPFAGDTDAFVAKLNSRGVLLWSTFLGGSSGDDGLGIIVDGSGNVYVTGLSVESWGDNPTIPFTGSSDAFVAKLDGSGTFLWNAFLGGSEEDAGYDIGVDGSGNVYVTGHSLSSWGTNIISPYVEGYDGFVAKLDGGGALAWNTFLGGTGWDFGNGIAVNANGDASVTGKSEAGWGSDPLRAFTELEDAFVARLDPSGTLTWNTFLGGIGWDSGNGIAVDSEGNISVTGTSDYGWGETTLLGFTDLEDAFVARLDPLGALAWNTFLGGSGWDSGWGVAVDPKGVIYVTGISDASWGSPIKPFAGSEDALVVRLDGNGTLVWNTFVGGPDYDDAYVIAVDGVRGINIVGTSWGTWGSPVRKFASGADAFVARLGFKGIFPSTGTKDGWILESAEFSGVGGTINAGATTFNLGDDLANKQYRGLLSFNTASLPPGAEITNVTLKVKKQGLTGRDPFTTHGNILVDIRKGPFSGNAALQSVDFQATPSKSGVITIKRTALSGWYSGAMASANFRYINRTNITQFRLRFTKDDNNDWGADYLKLYSGNAASSSRPVLEIEYYLP